MGRLSLRSAGGSGFRAAAGDPAGRPGRARDVGRRRTRDPPSAAGRAARDRKSRLDGQSAGEGSGAGRVEREWRGCVAGPDPHAAADSGSRQSPAPAHTGPGGSAADRPATPPDDVGGLDEHGGRRRGIHPIRTFRRDDQPIAAGGEWLLQARDVRDGGLRIRAVLDRPASGGGAGWRDVPAGGEPPLPGEQRRGSDWISATP